MPNPIPKEQNVVNVFALPIDPKKPDLKTGDFVYVPHQDASGCAPNAVKALGLMRPPGYDFREQRLTELTIGNLKAWALNEHQNEPRASKVLESFSGLGLKVHKITVSAQEMQTAIKSSTLAAIHSRLQTN